MMMQQQLPREMRKNSFEIFEGLEGTNSMPDSPLSFNFSEEQLEPIVRGESFDMFDIPDTLPAEDKMIEELFGMSPPSSPRKERAHGGSLTVISGTEQIRPKWGNEEFIDLSEEELANLEGFGPTPPASPKQTVDSRAQNLLVTQMDEIDFDAKSSDEEDEEEDEEESSCTGCRHNLENQMGHSCCGYASALSGDETETDDEAEKDQSPQTPVVSLRKRKRSLSVDPYDGDRSRSPSVSPTSWDDNKTYGKDKKGNLAAAHQSDECPLCDKVFGRRQTLRKHLLNHSGHGLAYDPNDPNKVNPNIGMVLDKYNIPISFDHNPAKCEYCDPDLRQYFGFSSKQNLRQHQKFCVAYCEAHGLTPQVRKKRRVNHTFNSRLAAV